MFISEYFGENSYLCNKFTRTVNVTSLNIQTAHQLNSEPSDFWEEKSCIKNKMSPDRNGSVCCVSSCKAKSHQFDSQSGHMPGLRAGPSLGRVREGTN